MHTKVFGKYNGPEDVMARTSGYTEINVIVTSLSLPKETLL